MAPNKLKFVSKVSSKEVTFENLLQKSAFEIEQRLESALVFVEDIANVKENLPNCNVKYYLKISIFENISHDYP